MNTSAISFIDHVHTHALDTFHKIGAIAFLPGCGLNGKVIVKYSGDNDDEVIPDLAIYGLKYLAFKDIKIDKLVGSFLLTRKPTEMKPLDHVVPLALTSAIPVDITFPKDGHRRWHFGAPAIGSLYGYLIHNNQVLEINPNDLNLDGEAIDMQVVFASGYYTISIKTITGMIYEAKVRPDKIFTNGLIPKFDNIKSDVTALLTVPRDGKFAAFYGTKEGIFVGDDLIPYTKDLFVTALDVDSESPRIFATTADGKIFSIPVDERFMLTTKKLIPIDDVMRETEKLFAGPTVLFDKDTVGILAIDFTKVDTGFLYAERMIRIPQILAV
jgi:hypothetical protein